MCCKSWKTILPLVVTFLLSSLLTGFIQDDSESKNVSEKSVKGILLTKTENKNEIPFERPNCVSLGGRGNATPMIFLEQPVANYTESARINGIKGTVELSITLLANRKIGKIRVIKYLTHGLTEEAIKAAKKIKFTPATNQNGKPVNVVSKVEYKFTL